MCDFLKWSTRLGWVVVVSMLGCAGPRGVPGGADTGGGSGSAARAGQGSEHSAGREANVVIQKDVRLSLSVEGGDPSAGEPIELVLVVTNDGETAVVLDFPNGQRYDFEIFAADGSSVWHWGEEMFFTMMLGRETIAAGGALKWSERVEDGLPAGTYRAVGTLAAMDRIHVELTLTVEG